MDAILNILSGLWSFISKVVIVSFPFLNAIFIIGAGILGSLVYQRIKPGVRGLLVKCLGIAVILCSVHEIFGSLFVLQDGQLETDGTLLVVISLLLGWLFGEALSLDTLLGKLGLALHRLFEDKTPTAGRDRTKKNALPPEEAALLTLKREDCARGFIATVTICGFSSLIFTHFLEGRINDDPIPMLIKLAFDLVLAFGLASAYGSGVSYGGVFALLVQGELGLAYSIWGDFFTPALLGQLSLVGGAILLASGICLCRGKKFHAANFIPALFIPIIYTAVMNKVDEAVEAAKDKKK
jgi:uncharacterized membrane protein YqgA involved in biofilm formation